MSTPATPPSHRSGPVRQATGLAAAALLLIGLAPPGQARAAASPERAGQVAPPELAPPDSRSEAAPEAEGRTGKKKPEAQTKPEAQDKSSGEASESEDLLFVTAAALHDGTGTLQRPGRLLIAGGVVKALGPELEAPENARRWDFPGRVISPALVDPAVEVQLAGGEARGGLSSAALSASDQRDPFDPWLVELRAEGLGAFALVPAGAGTFQGRTTAVGTTGPGAAGAPVLVEQAALACSLESSASGSAARAAARGALERELEKTEDYAESWTKWRAQEKADAGKSRTAIEREERRRKKDKTGTPRVKRPSRDEGREVLVQVLEKKLPLRLHADRRETVEAALALSRERGLELVLEGCLECGELAEELAESRAVVLLRPLSLPLDEGPRGQPDPELVARLAATDVRLAASAGGAWPAGPGWLRVAAAVLAGRGLEAERAFAAITSEAAAAAGLGKTHGRLAPGRAAELLVWTGDPLDPSSRVERFVTAAETKRADESDETETADGPAETRELS